MLTPLNIDECTVICQHEFHVSIHVIIFISFTFFASRSPCSCNDEHFFFLLLLVFLTLISPIFLVTSSSPFVRSFASYSYLTITYTFCRTSHFLLFLCLASEFYDIFIFVRREDGERKIETENRGKSQRSWEIRQPHTGWSWIANNHLRKRCESKIME